MKLILYKNKFLILTGNEHKKIGKLIKYKNKIFTVARWNIKTYLVCTERGIKNLPSLLCGFDFSAYNPYAHQSATSDFLIKNFRAFCWNDAGTGKTASCLWAYDYLRKKRILRKMLIICPLSTTKKVWDKEFFSMLTAIPFGILVGSKQKRLKLLKKGLDVYVINTDGIKVLLEELKKWKPELIIVDEHTYFKNPTSRFEALKELSEKAKAVWMLSGTPMAQAPTDVFYPATLICPDSVGRSFYRFRDRVMYKIGEYIWLPRAGFEQTIKAMIKPVIRFSRDECLDLPDVVKLTYEIQLSAKQKDAFDILKKDSILVVFFSKFKLRNLYAYVVLLNAKNIELLFNLLKFETTKIMAVNAGVMRNKLLQVCSGYLYDIDKNIINLSPIDRLETLRDIIAESPRGVLVFASYKSTIYAIEKYLKKDFNVQAITGETPLSKRDDYFSDFQAGKIKALIAHPRTTGHGLTLTNADTVIWYLVTSDNELYEQANCRIQRIGQKHKTRVVHFVSTLLERKVLKRLEEKRSVQGVLLEFLEEK